MPRRAYATTQDYADLYGMGAVAADGITDGSLAEATITIDELLVGAIYPVDTIGGHTNMPTQTTEQQHLREAVCAQARWMSAAGDPTGQGMLPNLQSASIGSVSWSAKSDAPLPGCAGQTITGRPLSASALALLRVAGLLPTGVTVLG